MRILIRADERAALVGKTASGKTYLARHIVKKHKRLIVLDPKGMLTTPDWNLETVSRTNLRKFKDGYAARIRFPAPYDGDWTEPLSLAYEIGNVVLYIDEVYGVVKAGARMPDALRAIYTRGRERGIGAVAATQRPTWVPIEIFSEAEWFFMFRLSMPDDRRRVAGFIGPEVERPIQDEHGFFTYNPRWKRAVYTERFRAGEKTLKEASA